MVESQPEEAGIYYRPLRPSDEPSLQQLHARLFPLDYDQGFFSKAVAGADGIVAWAAAAPLPSLTLVGELAPQLVAPPPPRQEGQQAEALAGFITARAFPALYADPHDRALLGLAAREADQERVLYVLTLGVAEAYQRCGIARRLLGLALRYAADTACRAVYLHVAEFNAAARAFYAAAGFRQLAVLPGFYTIRTGRQPQQEREHYDACLLGLIRPAGLTPWAAVNLALEPLTAVVSSLGSCMARRRDGSAAGAAPPSAGFAAAGAVGARRAAAAPVIEELAEGGAAPRSSSAAPRGPQQPPQPPPEWLRSLFTRQ